jgi:hypothetical protein
MDVIFDNIFSENIIKQNVFLLAEIPHEADFIKIMYVKLSQVLTDLTRLQNFA